MTATQIRPVSRLSPLVAGIRAAIDSRADWAGTAQLVADQMRRHLPTPDVLTAEQRLGSPDDYVAHNLHAEPGGSFSIIALIWRPGQITRIHDHITWCVFGVLQGVEHEELFDADLNLIGESDNHVGDVSGFAPPGDIHRVRNTADETAISIHVYGTDVTRVGSHPSQTQIRDCQQHPGVQATPAAVAAVAAPLVVDARVLIADDNPVNHLVIQGMLAKRDVGADVVENGREVLQRLSERPYDAIFMDCQMPELDGYATTGAIRAGETGDQHVPIIAMTANAMTGDRERCLEAGMDDYLAKPLRPDELDRVLGRWLGLGPHAAATRALVDEARLRTLRVDYADIAGQLAALFTDTTPAMLDEIGDAHALGDDEALRRAAHKLKGSCQNIGATFMATLAGSMELGEATDASVDELREAFTPTSEALEAALVTSR